MSDFSYRGGDICSRINNTSSTELYSGASETEQSPGSDDLVQFKKKLASSGRSIDYNPDTGLFTFRRRGLYQVLFKGLVSTSSTKSTHLAGVVLIRNGDPVPGTLDEALLASSSDRATLVILTAFRVTNDHAEIGIRCKTSNTTFLNASVVVQKV